MPTIPAMRTTLRIDDDVMEAAKSLARAESRTVGEVISRLARKGLAPSPSSATEAGFPVFEVSATVSPITAETVRRADEEA